MALVLLIPTLMAGSQAVVEDSGSTNSPGLRVMVEPDGNASVELRDGEVRHVTLNRDLCKRFLHDLSEAGSLAALPARHCAKSVSFGSRLTVEFNGEKSPDLSCPGAPDARMEALEKDAREILQAAREAAGIHPRNVLRIQAPVPPKQ